MANWMIKPVMDDIEFEYASKMFVCHKADSNYVWTTDGKRIVNTTAAIASISDRMVLLINEEDGGLYGFVSDKSKFVNMVSTGNRCRYLIDKNYPYFSHGLLLVKDTDDNLYYYVNAKGQVLGEGYVAAYPFLNRCASVVAYKDEVKRKETYVKLINTRFDEILMSKNSKPLKSGSFSFISSVSGNKMAICIDGKAVYSYDNNTDDCVRFSTDDSSEKNTYVQLLDKNIIKHTMEGGFYFNTDKGKLMFNDNGQYIGSDWDLPKKQITEKRTEFPKRIDTFENNGLFGIEWNQYNDRRTVLDCQFEEVKTMYDNLAVVKLHGKYGVVAIDNLKSIGIKINDGNPLVFDHAQAEYPMVLDIPTTMHKNDIESIVCTSSTQCDPDLNTINEGYTNRGTMLSLNCVFHAPKNIKTTQTRTDYMMKIKYQGLLTSAMPVTVQTCYNSAYTMELGRTALMNDTVYVELAAVTELDTADIYKVDIELSSDSVMSYRVGRIGNKKFGVKIYDIVSSYTPLVFTIKEEGCAPIAFPYNLTYTRPMARKKGAAKLEAKREEEEVKE